MKKFKIAIMMSLMVLLVACSNKTANLEAFYNQVEESSKIEKDIEKTSSELEKLENDKLQLFNKVDKAKLDQLKGIAEDLTKNTDKRKAAADKEVKVMEQSKKTYDDAKDEAKSVDDKTQKQQVEKLVTALDEKYNKHDSLMKAYHEILKQEQALFDYLKEDTIDKAVVNEKIAAVTKLYEGFQKKTDDYTKAQREVDQARKPIVKTLNEA
ncbi:YkyA family protein [Macrococcus capreoli]|uniref:YkyA family protein n=1 Tax=Macrococcus capreoli TaxID=2982690 RepID=UPI0021D5BE55|nr:YkyA family protein [Macrococcus sp. TMW 2.2395]MCU7557588.1 YkyA family protein [Macrococcus sp. TMW 2.2395]